MAIIRNTGNVRDNSATPSLFSQSQTVAYMYMVHNSFFRQSTIRHCLGALLHCAADEERFHGWVLCCIAGNGSEPANHEEKMRVPWLGNEHPPFYSFGPPTNIFYEK